MTEPSAWWLIVAEESAPFRERPLAIHSVSKLDPLAWLADYEDALAKSPTGGGKHVALRAFWKMDRVPTKRERENYP